MFDKLCEFYKLHAIPYTCIQNINNVPASSVWHSLSFWVSCAEIFGITTVESELLGTSVSSVVSIFLFFGLLLASDTSPPVAGHGSGYWSEGCPFTKC